MTCRGRAKGGVVVLENPAAIPEGTDVEIHAVETPEEKEEREIRELREMLLSHAGKGKGLPRDFADNHGHYIHGTPKRK
jgi:hypothetical protein